MTILSSNPSVYTNTIKMCVCVLTVITTQLVEVREFFFQLFCLVVHVILINMPFAWEVVSVISVLALLWIVWLYYTINKKHVSYDEICRSKPEETSVDPLTTSPHLSSLQLFIFRFAILLCLTAVDIEFRLQTDASEWDIPVLAYYTVWIWLSLYIYFCILAVLTLKSHLQKERMSFSTVHTNKLHFSLTILNRKYFCIEISYEYQNFV